MANTPMNPTLGTLLRHLIENLDSAVEEAYIGSGLDYRPRYTPIVRALLHLGPSSIRTISNHARISHSAASQTVSEMVKYGWAQTGKGSDARQHIVALTPKAEEAMPTLMRHWAATELAVSDLDQELPYPLSNLLREAIDALERSPFLQRIEHAVLQPEVVA